jgi:AcrR family transcriptional regulator
MDKFEDAPFSRKRLQHEREEFILQVTEEMLAQRGYYDMSMDEIAARVGISKVTLYRHFATKEDLVFALFTHNVPIFLQELDQIIVSKDTSLQKMEQISQRGASHILRHHSFLYYAFTGYSGEATLFLRGKQKELMGIQDALMQRLLPLIQAGQAEGIFDQTFTAFLLCEAFLRIVAPLASQRHAFSSQATDEEIITTVTRLYLKTLLASP